MTLTYLSRRKLISRSMDTILQGSCVGTLLPFGARVGFAQGEEISSGQAAEPHFFLHVHFDTGFDSTYLFDARSKEFWQQGLFQNYLSNKELVEWEDGNARKLWVPEYVKQLYPNRDYFSVLTGIVMSTSFEGHLQNKLLLCTGNPFTGEYFGPQLQQFSGNIDFINTGSNIRIPVSNAGKSLLLDYENFKGFNFNGATGSSENENSEVKANIDDIILEHYKKEEERLAPGLVRSSITGMANAFRSADDLGIKFSDLAGLDAGFSSDESLNDFEKNLHLSLRVFKSDICRSVVLNEQGIGNLSFDAHDPGTASDQENAFTQFTQMLNSAIGILRDTPYSEQKSMMDVTTVLITTEFSRTCRQVSKNINETGTDHNPLTNTAFLIGKGIKANQVIGGSDLDELDESGAFANIPPYHKQFDSLLIKPMGRPFDFATGKVLDSLEEFSLDQFITSSSLVNTLFQLYGLDPMGWRKNTSRQGAAIAKPIKQLLA